MTDFTDHIFRSSPDRLARLIGTSDRDVDLSDTEPAELAAAWQRQLCMPVGAGQSTANGAETPTRQDNSGQGPVVRGIRTLREVLNDPKPPLDLLSEVKEFAKINREHPDSALPKEIATVLYYATISVALLGHGHRITCLDNSEMRVGMTWALEQPWLDDTTRRLFQEGVALIDRQ